MRIMNHASEDSKYFLRQTSAPIMRLFDDNLFADFHSLRQDLQLEEPHMRYDVIGMPSRYQNRIADCFHHHEFRAACLRAEKEGKLQIRLAALHIKRHCDGCNIHHESFFVLPEDIERQKLDSGELHCFGRIGQITLCDHNTSAPIAWQDIDQSLRRSAVQYPGSNFTTNIFEATCTDLSHEPVNAQRHSGNWSIGSAFPRIAVKSLTGWVAYPSLQISSLDLGWDLPLLDIDSWMTPSLDVIRQTLSTSVMSALFNHKICPHISASNKLRDFVQSGICECFTYPNPSSFTVKDYKHSLPGCKCGRKKRLKCRHCDAVYTWYFTRGRIILSYRRCYERIKGPTSYGWMAALDEQSYKDGLLTDADKHVLWCDSTSCRTGPRRRWEELVWEADESE